MIVNDAGNLGVKVVTLFFQVEQQVNSPTTGLRYLNERRNLLTTIAGGEPRTGVEALKLSQCPCTCQARAASTT